MEAFVQHKRLQDRRISIKLSLIDSEICIFYQDNAGGLDEAFLTDPNQIFRPHITTKVNALGEPTGTGMGMYLIKAVLDDNDGKILLSNDIEDAFTASIILKRHER